MNENLRRIYDTAFDMLEIRLNKREEIAPFTVTLEPRNGNPILGMYELVAGDTAGQIDVIRNDLREKIEKEEIRALCLCYGVNVTDPRTNEKTSAILMELAGTGEATVSIYVPYKFTDEDIIKKPFQIKSYEKYF